MSTPIVTRLGGGPRRATMLVAVLGTAMIVAIIGLSALTNMRIRNRGAEGSNDLVAARLYAQSAIELGMQWIASDPDWRTTYGEGFWALDQPIGNGAFSLEVNDLGSSKQLENSSDSDPVLLTGTGAKGAARYKLQVTLLPKGSALTCLEVALHANNDLIFNAALAQCDQIISANNSLTASLSEIYADVEAVNAINGEFYLGKRTPGITPRTMPDPTAVFDQYTSDGTWISFASLPAPSGKTTISKAVFSPNVNPSGGTTNPAGIYVIDCQGQPIIIEYSRVIGTLVLLDPGSGSQVRNAVNWKPAFSNYPALLVQGSFDLAFGTSPMNEAALSTNFNPPGAPDESGAEDGDQFDTYPSEITGLVYVSADLTNTAGSPTVRGVVVVGNTFTGDATISLGYDAAFLNSPPPGFGDAPRMTISPGTWRQVVD